MIKFKPSKVPIISLAIIGDTLSGKTCMIKKFLKESFEMQSQTIALDMILLDIKIHQIKFILK